MGSLFMDLRPDKAIAFQGKNLKIQRTPQKLRFIIRVQRKRQMPPIPAGSMRKDIPYCVKYTGGRFYLQGELEIHVIVLEVNAEPSELEKEAYRTAYGMPRGNVDCKSGFSICC